MGPDDRVGADSASTATGTRITNIDLTGAEAELMVEVAQPMLSEHSDTRPRAVIGAGEEQPHFALRRKIVLRTDLVSRLHNDRVAAGSVTITADATGFAARAVLVFLSRIIVTNFHRTSPTFEPGGEAEIQGSKKIPYARTAGPGSDNMYCRQGWHIFRHDDRRQTTQGERQSEKPAFRLGLGKPKVECHRLMHEKSWPPAILNAEC